MDNSLDYVALELTKLVVESEKAADKTHTQLEIYRVYAQSLRRAVILNKKLVVALGNRMAAIT